ncbi:MAG: acyl--CoA ligase [Eubacterium sp.]|nr:acyl--CoA ligase [Eubacterium sp.]
MKIIDCLYENRGLDKTAVRFGSDSISYKELWNKSLAYSEKIKRLNTQNVAILLPNSIDYFISYYSILLGGKTVVPIGYYLGQNEVQEILNETGACLITTSDRDVYECEDVLYIDKNDDWEVPDFDYDSYKTSEVAVVFPTSGTTSRSKYVQLSDLNLMQNVQDIMKILSMSREKNRNDNELIVLPLTASFCNTTQMLVCLYCSMTITILDGRISLPKIFQLMKTNDITYCEMTPTLLKIFAQHYNMLKDEKFELKRISCGGETISEDELKIVQKQLTGVEVYLGYGLTEAGPVVATQCSEDYLYAGNSVGKLLDSFEIRFGALDNQDDYPDGAGEIEIKGPCIMKGYLNEEKPSVVEGWFATGDIGYMDENNYLYIIGRKKNIIISGGRNINAEEVENVVRKYDAVEECRVYGEKNSIYGEVVVIDVVKKKDCSIDNKELIHFCKEYLADYKIPQKFNYVDFIKKNSSGKIIRY